MSNILIISHFSRTYFDGNPVRSRIEVSSITTRDMIGFLFPLILLLVALLASSLRVLNEYERGVIFFLGKCTGVRGPGLIILIPVFERMSRVVLRTVTMDIPSQKIITKDNVSIDIAAVAYYHIIDPMKSVIAIEDVYKAVNQISQTTVRNVVGQFSLDQLLSQTVDINAQIKNVIDQHTEPWGAQVTAVEIKDIAPPGQHAARDGQGSRGGT